MKAKASESTSDFEVSTDGTSQVMADYMDKDCSVIWPEPGRVFEPRDLKVLNGLKVRQDIFGNIIMNGEEFAWALKTSELEHFPSNYMKFLEDTVI